MTVRNFARLAATQCPRLLVSVRSVDEALQAIAGGVEILDVKEPARGSLGMATIDEMVQIAAASRIASGVPLSVALGEVCDWTESSTVPALPHGISFAKLGLSQCASAADWRADLQRVRTRFQRQSSSPLRWVSVAYADVERAQSPRVRDVLNDAIESDCAGLLIDTWSKDESTLLDTIDAVTLARLADDCHSAGLFFALAGKLGLDSLPLLANVPVDVIGIRSAACVESDRTSHIDGVLISDFRRELGRCFDRRELGGRSSR